VIKMEESIDIKHEPLTSDVEDCSLNVVSLWINKELKFQVL
jgi:hypothetical protein